MLASSFLVHGEHPNLVLVRSQVVDDPNAAALAARDAPTTPNPTGAAYQVAGVRFRDERLLQGGAFVASQILMDE